MTDEPRTFQTDTVAANLGRQQGLGVGQRELEAQRDPQVMDDGIEEEVERLSGDEQGGHPTPKDLQESHGQKTRAANRERVKGSRQFNP